MSTLAWIIVAVIALLLLGAVLIYNRLIELRNRIANAFGQIDVQLKRRHDLVPNLVEVAQRYMKHEAETLQAVIAARGQAQGAAAGARQRPGDAQALGAMAMAEQGLMGSLGRLLAVAESYPELKADARMRELGEELTSTENRIGFARQAYNDAALDYNNAIGVFPALVVARLFNFAPNAMLQSTTSEAERAVPRVVF
ncbi:MAG: LemA family protein [Pseudomonadota bacterium]|nr:LemA family protein [Pseudomonadota bacterium]